MEIFIEKGYSADEENNTVKILNNIINLKFFHHKYKVDSLFVLDFNN